MDNLVIGRQRWCVRDIHGGPTSVDLEDAIRCADVKLKECAERRERLVRELSSVDSAIAYQEAAKAKYKAQLAELLAPRELRCGRDLRRKILDDLVAQRAAITQRIEELEAQNCC